MTTAVGQRRSVRLADGTRIDLDGATTLMLDLHGAERRVSLTAGEAAFEVVHDPARPFVVAIGPVRLRDLGTAFDVAHGAGGVRVAVSRGAVSLSTGLHEVSLSAGMSAKLDADGQAMQVSRVPVTDVGAWRQGRRLYIDATLADVAADLNRNYSRPIQLADASVARLRFTGVLVLGPRTEVVHRLVALLPLRQRVQTRGAIVLSSKDP